MSPTILAPNTLPDLSTNRYARVQKLLMDVWNIQKISSKDDLYALQQRLHAICDESNGFEGLPNTLRLCQFIQIKLVMQYIAIQNHDVIQKGLSTVQEDEPESYSITLPNLTELVHPNLALPTWFSGIDRVWVKKSGFAQNNRLASLVYMGFNELGMLCPSLFIDNDGDDGFKFAQLQFSNSKGTLIADLDNLEKVFSLEQRQRQLIIAVALSLFDNHEDNSMAVPDSLGVQEPCTFDLKCAGFGDPDCLDYQHDDLSPNKDYVFPHLGLPFRSYLLGDKGLMGRSVLSSSEINADTKQWIQSGLTACREIFSIFTSPESQSYGPFKSGALKMCDRIQTALQSDEASAWTIFETAYPLYAPLYRLLLDHCYDPGSSLSVFNSMFTLSNLSIDKLFFYLHLQLTIKTGEKEANRTLRDQLYTILTAHDDNFLENVAKGNNLRRDIISTFEALSSQLKPILKTETHYLQHKTFVSAQSAYLKHFNSRFFNLIKDYKVKFSSVNIQSEKHTHRRLDSSLSSIVDGGSMSGSGSGSGDEQNDQV